MATNLAAPLDESRSIADGGAFQSELPADFITDMKSPVLESYTLDLDSGDIVLTFNETIRVIDFDPTAITFYNDADNETEQYAIVLPAMSVNTDINWIYINFTVRTEELIRIKYFENLATSINNTFLESDISLIEDLSDQDAALIGPDNRLQASYVFPDRTIPRLEYFDINFSDKTFALFSDEPIYLPSVQPEFITLQSLSLIHI